jgi:hypothetical protein
MTAQGISGRSLVVTRGPLLVAGLRPLYGGFSESTHSSPHSGE